MLQDGANLLDGDAREPLNELGYECAVFEVLEERRNRHSGAAKYPGAAHALRVAFNGRTGGPIIIGYMVPLARKRRLRGRDCPYGQPPAQTRTCSIPASYVVDHIRIVMWRSPICGAPPAWADGIGHGVVLAAT
jgi:hypothetical protein